MRLQSKYRETHGQKYRGKPGKCSVTEANVRIFHERHRQGYQMLQKNQEK